MRHTFHSCCATCGCEFEDGREMYEIDDVWICAECESALRESETDADLGRSTRIRRLLRWAVLGKDDGDW